MVDEPTTEGSAMANDAEHKRLEQLRDQLEQIADLARYSYGPCSFDILMSSRNSLDEALYNRVGSLPARKSRDDSDYYDNPDELREREPFWCDVHHTGAQCLLWRGDSRTVSELQHWGDAAFASLLKYERLSLPPTTIPPIMQRFFSAEGRELTRRDSWRIRGYHGLFSTFCSIAVADSYLCSLVDEREIEEAVEIANSSEIAAKRGRRQIFRRIEVFSYDCIYLFQRLWEHLIPATEKSFVDFKRFIFVLRGEQVPFDPKHIRQCLAILDLLIKARGARLSRKDMASAHPWARPWQDVRHGVARIRKVLPGLIGSDKHGYWIDREKL